MILFSCHQQHVLRNTGRKGSGFQAPNLLQELVGGSSEIRAFQVKLGGGFGGLMFPSHSDPSKALTRAALGHWLKKAEELAKLLKLDGSLWHAYRRGWATARKDLPLKDVAAVGGWKDIQTLVNCYQQADDDTMLLVMLRTKKISERVPNS